MSGIKLSLLIIGILLIAVTLWNPLTPHAPQAVTPVTSRADTLQQSTLFARIAALEDALFDQQNTSRELAARLNRLEQQRKLSTTAITPPATGKHDDADTPAIRTKTLKPPPTLQQKLRNAGLPDDTALRIHQRIGENRLALLKLRNRAIREEWIDTPEYIEQMQALRDPATGIREQEGDTVYDQYLYAAGRPNRVMVTEVYAGSAADQAGIQPRDIILSYAQSNIFGMRELQQATTDGLDGEAVLIELSRDGERISTSVPRGPLGIAMTMTRIRPD